MGKHLVIVGAGHAHLTILKNLNTFKNMGHDVTVISATPYHYYSGMGPGLMSGIYRPQDVRFHVKKMVEDRGGRFIVDKVININPQKKRLYLNNGDTIKYDVVSFNTGSFIPVESMFQPDESVVVLKPIENLLDARNKIIEQLKTKTLKITVAGGGPAGVEISANLRRLIEHQGGRGEIRLVAGSQLLSNFDPKLRRYALKALKNRNVHVMEGVRLKSVKNGMAELTDGVLLESDFVFVAVGIKPSRIFDVSGVPTGADGGLLVNSYLQCVSHPEIFGGGDCISFKPHPLAKVGVYAVRQNSILFNNLQTALQGGAYQRFVPQKTYLLIFNMGDGTGIFVRNSLVWQGRSAFILKNFIDTTFMKKFQVSGERSEQE